MRFNYVHIVLLSLIAAVSCQPCNSTNICPSFLHCCGGECTSRISTIPLGDPCDPNSSACARCAGLGACIGGRCVLSTDGCPCDVTNAACTLGFCQYVAKDSYICSSIGSINGAHCYVDDNCASSNCIKGTCRGIGYVEDSCQWNSDCLSNLCASSPPGSPKKCIAPLPKGALCKVTEEGTDPCAPGLACSRDSEGTALICVEKFSKPSGSPCLSPPLGTLAVDESCAGSVCNYYVEDSLIKSACDAAGAHQAGENCDQRTMDLPVCAAGLVCNAASSLTRGVCVSPYSVGEGGACVNNVVCASGLMCQRDNEGQLTCSNTVNQPCNATLSCGNRARCASGVCVLDESVPPLQRPPTCVPEFIDVFQGRCYSDVFNLRRGMEFSWSTSECEAIAVKYLCCAEYCLISDQWALKYPFIVDCAQNKLVSWSPAKCCGETDVNKCQQRVQGCAAVGPSMTSPAGGPSAVGPTGEVNESQLALLIVFGIVGLLALVGLVVVVVRDKRNKVW